MKDVLLKIFWGTVAVLFIILYFIIMAHRMNEYRMGKKKGMHCHKSKETWYFTTIYYYQPGVKPFRRYHRVSELWKEFYTNKINK